MAGSGFRDERIMFVQEVQEKTFYLTYLFTFTCKCFVTFSLYGTKIGSILKM